MLAYCPLSRFDVMMVTKDLRIAEQHVAQVLVLGCDEHGQRPCHSRECRRRKRAGTSAATRALEDGGEPE